MDRRLPGLSNAHNWEKFWEFQKSQTDAEWEKRLGVDEQIFSLTIDDSYVLAVKVLASNDPGYWYKGGFANQRVRTSIEPGGVVDSDINLAHKFLALRRFNICIFPKIATEWALSLEFWNYHKGVQVECWKYTGEDIGGIDRIDALEASQDARLSRIETDSEYILDQLNILENKI